MDPERVALVVDTAWYVDPIELLHAKFCGPKSGSGTKLHITNPLLMLWYQLEFSEGRFWARFDWIDVVVDNT